jgi:hypothetical protein
MKAEKSRNFLVAYEGTLQNRGGTQTYVTLRTSENAFLSVHLSCGSILVKALCYKPGSRPDDLNGLFQFT